MSKNSNWLLPEYIQDILPDEALSIENMRSAILELFRVSGYQLVSPPLLEYVDSLLVNEAGDVNLRTFKLVDQLSGAHRRAFAQPPRGHSPVLRGQRVAHTAFRSDAHARALADRRGTLRPRWIGKRP
jgi:Histidyl-tRNA synthetase